MMDGIPAAFLAAIFAATATWLAAPQAARKAVVIGAGSLFNLAISWRQVRAVVVGVFVLIICLAIDGRARAETSVTLTKSEQDQAVIEKSTEDEYDGTCPCSWSKNKQGEYCGGVAADKREGGADPVCTVEQVTYDEREKAGKGL